MNQQQVLSRALNTHNYRKDVTETGGARDRTPSSILGKAQDSLYSSKTGFRRVLVGGGSSKELAVPASAPEEPETLEITEPTRQFTNPEDVAARVAKIRRSSMTTYTVNIGGAPAGQVEREVRRLAGLAPAFIRPSAAAEVNISHATSFDAVEEMGAVGGADGGADGSCLDSDGEVGAPPLRSSTYGGGGASAGSVCGGTAAYGRGPIKSAFSSGAPGDPCRISVCGDASGGGVRQSIELADVTRLSSSGNVVIPGLDGRGGPGRMLRPPSLPQAFLAGGSAAAAAAAAATAGGGGGSAAGGLSVSPVPSSSSQVTGQLGLMKDRKLMTRGAALDGVSPSSSPSAGGGGASPTSVLKLPTLSSPPGRAPSGSQLALTQSGPVSDSRPGSSRLVLGRSTIGVTSTGGAAAAAMMRGGDGVTSADRAAGLEDIEIASGGSGSGGGLSRGGAGTEGAMASGGGGRWFQQDTEDVEAMLAGNEDLLERLMAADGVYGMGGGGGGVGSPARLATATGDGSPGGEPGLLLPKLADPQDRATAQLQELWKVQANLEDQLARERQAMATGRVRRGSVLEDVAGTHQPRWQVSYNVDAPVTHAKLGTVDATRRSEMDRAHLAKIVKEQKGPAPPAVAAAAVSPVVARARRLSTVMVA